MGYFSIKYLYCDDATTTTFQLFSTVEENPPTSSQCRPEEGQSGPCDSPLGLWSGVSISRKVLWSFYH